MANSAALKPASKAAQADLDRLEADADLDVIRDERRAMNASRVDSDFTSWDDAFALFGDLGIDVDDAADVVGDGYTAVDKDALVNKQMLLTEWRVSMPDNETYGAPYVVVKGITREGSKFRFTDGSKGVAAELIALTERRVKAGHKTPNLGLLVRNGLTVSEYDTKTDSGESVHGRTFYLAP